MKNSLTYNVILGCIITFFCCSLSAQQSNTPGSDAPDFNESSKHVDYYLELKKLGYKDKEIYEDLGNANFLTHNYKAALFWYKKLKDVSENGTLPTNYQERYQYALDKSASSTTYVSNERDWLAQIKTDYELDNNPTNSALINSLASNYNEINFQQSNENRFHNAESLIDEDVAGPNAYNTPIALTEDGNTAFFSKAVQVKPLYGIFSKKQLVHKIYRASKINGQWKNIKEVALCPKNYSAMHPTVSVDGRRIFFASDMPGTFGKYDIYVSNINSDGTVGAPKNLGDKINTKKNDLYPSIVGGTTLFFASEGHKGYGGLDVYMAQVDRKNVGWSVNLGTPINSMEDDFSIQFVKEKGMGYVMSNRGQDKNTVNKVAFSYSNPANANIDDKGYSILADFNTDLKVDYSSSVFEDE